MSLRRSDNNIVSAKVPLHMLAHSRAGDKGNRLNVSIIAYREEDFPILLEQVTEERVREMFSNRPIGAVQRFELPRISALNFVIDDVLEGGVNGSLNLDGHGKSLSSHILKMEISVPRTLMMQRHNSILGKFE